MANQTRRARPMRGRSIQPEGQQPGHSRSYRVFAPRADGARRLRRFRVAADTAENRPARNCAPVKRPEGRAPPQILFEALNRYVSQGPAAARRMCEGGQIIPKQVPVLKRIGWRSAHSRAPFDDWAGALDRPAWRRSKAFDVAPVGSPRPTAISPLISTISSQRAAGSNAVELPNMADTQPILAQPCALDSLPAVQFSRSH